MQTAATSTTCLNNAARSSSSSSSSSSLNTASLSEQPTNRNELDTPHPTQAAATNPVIHQSGNPPALDFITIAGLAELLGSSRASVRHFADRLGFRFTTRIVGRRRKRLSCLTAAQAAAIADAHQAEAPAADPEPEPEPVKKSDCGFLYLLQLEPVLDPGRFKLGFSGDLDERLEDFLTAAPYAICIAVWPAHRSWERIAIVSIAQTATTAPPAFRTSLKPDIAFSPSCRS